MCAELMWKPNFTIQISEGVALTSEQRDNIYEMFGV